MQIKNVTMAALTALLFWGASQTAQAQAVMHKMEGEGFFIIQETGALVVQNKDTLKVDLLPPAEARLKDYASVDLKVGDIILLLNGKKVTTAKQFEELYKAIKAGEEVSLGIKRDGGLRIVKFVRADESKLPKRQMMMMKKEGGGGGEDQVQFQTPDGTREFTGKGARILPSSGLVIAMKDKNIVVIGVMPMAAEKFTGGEVKESDIIVSANGAKFADTDELLAMIEGLADGAKVELSIARDGKSLTVAFIKAPDTGRRIIKHN